MRALAGPRRGTIHRALCARLASDVGLLFNAEGAEAAETAEKKQAVSTFFHRVLCVSAVNELLQ
jgi:hypothetical protein